MSTRWTMVLVVAVSLMTGCSGEIGEPQVEAPPPVPPITPVAPAPPPAPDVERRFAFDFESDVTGNGALGSVFRFVSGDATVACEAGFISTVGTTIHSNQNDLEFWCEAVGDRTPLRWVSIGRPIDDFPSTLLGEVFGYLVDFIGFGWYDFAASDWDPGHIPLAVPDIQDGEIRTIRHDGDKLWFVASGRADCAGLSLFSVQGYHGTVPMDFMFGAATVWKGEAFTNFAGKVWKSAIPVEPVAQSCEFLETTAVVDEPIHAYAMFAVGDRLYIGGGGAPYLENPAYECAPIYATDGVEVEVIELQGCTDQQVTEIYSISLFDDSLYFGTYPDGAIYRLVSLAERIAVRDDRFNALLGGYWTDHDGIRYLESQAITVTGGRLLVGMFPWGEVIEDSGEVHRLFSGPARSADLQRPFVQDDANNWSQRVASLVVMNGRVCAATANTFAERYDAERDAFLDPSLADEYGRVYCAELPGQTMNATTRLPATSLAFVVDETDIRIEQDGFILSGRPHGLSEDAVRSILDAEGQISIGVGSYGPSQANSIRGN